jgi:hypothetical protein
LKIFDLVVAMSGSGPGFVTDVPGIYVYDMMGKAGRAFHAGSGGWRLLCASRAGGPTHPAPLRQLMIPVCAVWQCC